MKLFSTQTWFRLPNVFYRTKRNQLRMECCVCFESTSFQLQPCMHHMCEDCYKKWMPKSTTCPVCRTAVSFPGTEVLRIEFVAPEYWREHVGITLSNTPIGLQVLRMDRRDRAYAAGLRVGDIITHINHAAVTDHRTAVEILDRLALQKASIDVHRFSQPICRIS